MNTRDNKNTMPEPAQQYGLDQISMNDLVSFLKEFSVLLKKPRTGNPALGEALAKLAKVLQRHSKRDLRETLASLTVATQPKRGREKRASSHLEGRDLASLNPEQVKKLISSGEQLTKEDLIHLGTERLGIPRSGLQRQNKTAVLEAIETALRNEESLDVISREASRQGSRRLM